MPSVTCKIASKIKPEKWIEVEIGVDDDSGSKFWRLTAKSPVSFLSFNVTSGEWFPIAYLHNDNPEVSGIMLRTSEDDPFQGFDLLRTGSNFYRLICGQTIQGDGSREKHLDVRYRMDFLCA